MESNQSTRELSAQEMENISGGAAEPSILSTLAYYVGAAAKSIAELGTLAMENQNSLPANLKK